MDLDLHGIVGIRVVDASPTDVAAVRRQLGLSARPLARAPDVVVRFVDALPTPGLRFAEFGLTGFTGDGFFVLQVHKRLVPVRIDFDGIGQCCELVRRRNVLLEEVASRQAEGLAEALVSKVAYTVHHPDPCDLGALYAAMAPVCGGERDRRPERPASALPAPGRRGVVEVGA